MQRGRATDRAEEYELPAVARGLDVELVGASESGRFVLLAPAPGGAPGVVVIDRTAKQVSFEASSTLVTDDAAWLRLPDGSMREVQSGAVATLPSASVGPPFSYRSGGGWLVRMAGEGAGAMLSAANIDGRSWSASWPSMATSARSTFPAPRGPSRS